MNFTHSSVHLISCSNNNSVYSSTCVPKICIFLSIVGVYGLYSANITYYDRVSFSSLLLIFVMYVKPLVVIFCGDWDGLFSGDAHVRVVREFGYYRIVVLSRTTGFFCFRNLFGF